MHAFLKTSQLSRATFNSQIGFSRTFFRLRSYYLQFTYTSAGSQTVITAGI